MQWFWIQLVFCMQNHRILMLHEVHCRQRRRQRQRKINKKKTIEKHDNTTELPSTRHTYDFRLDKFRRNIDRTSLYDARVKKREMQWKL